MAAVRLILRSVVGMRFRVRALASVSLLALVVTLLAPSQAAAFDASTAIERISGPDRYATAVAISKRFAAPVDTAYVATGANFPDALSAAPAAAFAGGPLLLTPTGTLPEVVRAELRRLAPRLIVVVGGTGAVSASVYAELSGFASQIRRDSGIDRYATSRIVVERAFPAGTAVSPFLSTGANFPDALSASAAAGAAGSPVVLVDGSRIALDAPTRSLLSRFSIARLFLAGGTGVVSSGMEASVRAIYGSANVERLAGPDRYATSSAILSKFAEPAGSIYIAVGTGFADALAGAALAGAEGGALVVTPSACVPGSTLRNIGGLSPSRIVLLGGTGALGRGVAAGVECFAGPAFRGDGDKRVNIDVRPGTYRSAGGDLCYWERLNSFAPDFDSIIANDLGNGPRVVTIESTDVGFSSNRCGLWSPVQTAPALSAPYSEGVSVVGLQLDPGTYVASNSSGGCYWATLSGFSGELTDIIGNDFLGNPGQVVVEIGRDVVGFEASGCGRWSRTS